MTAFSLVMLGKLLGFFYCCCVFTSESSGFCLKKKNVYFLFIKINKSSRLYVLTVRFLLLEEVISTSFVYFVK